MSHLGQEPSSISGQRPFPRLWPRVQGDRLTHEILLANARQETLKERSISDNRLEPIAHAAERQLCNAEQNAATSPFIAWGALNAFESETLAAMSSAERLALWCSLTKEAEAKLGGTWRGKAAGCLKELEKELERNLEKTPEPKQNSGNRPELMPAKEPDWPRLELLRELHKHLCAHAQNNYYKLDLMQRYTIPIAPALLGLVVVAALGVGAAMTYWGVLPSSAHWAKPILSGVSAGLLGGVLSMAIRGRGSLDAKIPELRMSWFVSLTRPLLGGAAVFNRPDYRRSIGPPFTPPPLTSASECADGIERT